MSKRPKMPQAPDPHETAAAHAKINRINQYTPNGNAVYGYVGENGEFVAGQAPDGQQGALKIQETDFQKQLREGSEAGALGLQEALLGAGINLPDRAKPADMGALAQEYYDRNEGLLSEDFERDQMRAETRLQNRGLPVGSEAFRDGMRPVHDAQARARSALSAQALQYAGNEQSRRFNVERSARGDALREYMSAVTGQQSPSPLINTPHTSDVNLAGLVGQNYQAQMQGYQQQMANRSNMIGTIAGLAGVGLMPGGFLR